MQAPVPRRTIAVVAVLLLAVALLIQPSAPILLAVGDVSSCTGHADEAVATLASQLPGTIALLGDISQQDGSSDEYSTCFDPAWGRLRARLHPSAGNHDYQTAGAAGYFSYFGAAAGVPGQGWYSYEAGTWHIIVLNSNCSAIGGCGAGSPQLRWLVADLSAHPVACTLAYWHHPRISSGHDGSDARTDPLWRALAAAGADVVLAAHDHEYERLAPVDGIRSFVVGTGGSGLFSFNRPPGPHTERRANDSYGMLMLELRDGGYRWRFVPIPGDTLTDSGTGSCH